YFVKSITYGSTDLLKQLMRLAQSAPSELKITVAVDPEVSWGSLRGRITGLDMDKGPVKVVLNGATSYARFEAALNADGSFNFAKLPQGTYVPTLEGAIVSSNLSPSSVVVSGTELAGIEISASPSSATRSAQLEEPKGASISDFPGSG